ncbi:hypothetical protein ACNPQK_08530 [Acinetobacter guillouiae]|uniref:Uncharacterized protein n=3 Tax=Acinetobacter guillouiae TaxID=106649 RepID=N8Y9W8_ACIGI|nr:hypothetical protein [Acinetobacter guillouiae]ENV16448.1 hypothetical protein F964_03383 [Acinetobacter guillouiae NIPH 991]
MYGMQRPKKDSQSELIKGKGTGTSDSIKKNVPEGSFIMPADSTEKIGPQNLKNLGSPQPVNLSNGEFQIPPEQVHQVGVQALEQLKDSTHIPVDQPQLGFKPGQNKPELFFANGGLVTSPYPSADDIRKAQQNRIGGPQMRDVTPINRQLPAPSSTPSVSPSSPAPSQGGGFGARALSGLGNVAKGVGVLHGVGSMVGGAVTGFNTPTEQYAERMGLDPNAERGLIADMGLRTAGVMSDVGNAASFGILGRNFADKQRINAENANNAQQKRFDEWNAKKNNGNGTAPNPFGNEAKPATTTNTVPAATQSTQQQDPYAIQQKGNSFSYANPVAASQARANGIKEGEGLGFNVRPANDPKGVANFMKNTREMGPNEQQIQNSVAQREMNLGMQGYGNFQNPSAPQRTEEQEAERQQLLRMASTPIAGARGITANQTRILSELQQGDDNRSQQRYVTDANNAANVAQTGMREAGQTGRTAMQEQGTNNRFNANLGFDAQKFQATNDLANREFNLNSAEKGFGIRNSARLEKLYEQYDTAKTDEDRKSIQEKISRYTGGKADSGKDRYMTIGGGQVYDNQAGLINQPQRLFDTQTQKFIDTPQGQSQPSESNYKEGQVYTDASGNRAIYRNGQFQPVK